MKKIFTTFLIIVCSLFGFSQNSELFKKANDLYNGGDYVKATENYLKILDSGQHSADLYYNLGNAYYKLNEISPSIYYYEKALLLKPNDKEILNNLSYAQNMTLDSIEVLPETGLASIVNKITGTLAFDEWAKLAVVLMLLFVGLYILFYFTHYSTRKRVAFIASLLCLVGSVVTAGLAYVEYDNFNSDNPAIIFSDEIQVKAEPNDRSQQSFILHEGTKVNVLETLNEWSKIELTDGKTGWLSVESYRLLKDF